MQLASLQDDGGWADLLAQLSAGIDLTTTAREMKAFRRSRGVRDAATLLRLALVYGASGLSLRSTAAWAAEAGVARLTDVSLLERLQKCSGWLEHLWQARLAQRVPPLVMPGLGLAVRLVDATCVSPPGSKGTEWRLHMDYRPLEGRFGGAVLTNGRTAEGFHHFAAQPGELVVGDRAYAKARSLEAIHKPGAHFLVRIGWRSLALLDETKEDFNILGAIDRLEAGKLSTVTVHMMDGRERRRTICPARLIFAPLPEGAGERARLKAKRKAKRQGRGILPEGAAAANWLMLLTTVPEESASAEQLVALYRLRWQIELAFKRLKSLLHMDQLAARNPELARTWLSANLLIALMTEPCNEASDSFPSAPR